MKQLLPEEALAQHTAVLGKTGSGKTTTAKLIVENEVRAGSRICVLDPIKSDWWGLTSSADGKKPGLPFSILGGPRGHVPLHSSAGKAIAELVAGGQLPLSIIDMADFEPGGQARFFVDFAPALLRKMRGVLYLVIEEAHLFAPKERSGIGAENMSIHWAKTLATAGRSKGIRLIILTQRTQSLHNALLGSCDTLIAHRFITPADQEPINKWLKANVAPDVAREVAASLSSLKTGEAWVCSGEAKIFRRQQFPGISTFDNTATPTGRDAEAEREVEVARVDREALRAIIGDAVREAEENDPKLLKAELAKLRKAASSASAPDPVAIRDEYLRGLDEGKKIGRDELTSGVLNMLDRLGTLAGAITEDIAGARTEIHAIHARAAAAPSTVTPRTEYRVQRVQAVPGATTDVPILRRAAPIAPAGGAVEKAMPRAFLTALAQYPEGLTKRRILLHAEYRSSGDTSTCFAELLRNGWASAEGGGLRITAAGLKALGPFEPLPSGAILRQRLVDGDRLPRMERAFLSALFNAYPEPIRKGDLLEQTGYRSSGDTSSAFAHLVAIGYARSEGVGRLKASEDLFR